MAEREDEREKINPRLPLTVAVIDLGQAEATGYGVIGRRLPAAMAPHGLVPCHKREFNWDLRLCVSTPRAFLLGRGRRADDLVFHTMWETTRLPRKSVEVLNGTPAVWVPSQWCKEVFADSGVTVPIYVSGYGVDPDEFRVFDTQAEWDHRFEGKALEPQGKDDRPYTFMWAGHSLGDGRRYGGRKGGHLVIDAFVKLKLPDTRLIVKASSRSAMQNVIHPRIRMIQGDISIAEYAGLLMEAHCFVYPSAAEGFGLQPLEAMACGKPTIVPQWSGMTEYVHEDRNIVLPTSGMEEAWLYRKLFSESSQWATYSLDDIADRMKWCYEHREKARAIGMRAAEYVAAEWSWDRAGREGMRILRHIVYGG